MKKSIHRLVSFCLCVLFCSALLQHRSLFFVTQNKTAGIGIVQNQNGSAVLGASPLTAKLANYPDACNDNSVEAIRALGVHWHNKGAGANISMYPLDPKNTLGVLITLTASKSSQTMRAKIGRRDLDRQLGRATAGGNVSFPRMSRAGDNAKAPPYERYLGCDGATPGTTPRGTAIAVVQNFYCENIWHALANIHGVWLMMKVARVDPSEVSVIVPKEYGTPFADPPRYIADVLWPLFVDGREKGAARTNCFRRVAFIETPRYRPGPYWPNQGLKENHYCPAHAPYMKTHFSFYAEARNAAVRALGLPDIPGTNGTKPYVCYMSRRGRKERVRYFSPRLELLVEGALDAWASRTSGIAFDRMEFTQGVTFAEQWRRTSRCTILFGTHGAGLAHQIWMKSGGHVLEIGSHEKCTLYFGAMASWYGHGYTCLSEKQGHGILVNNQVYQSLNVTLLLDVLDSLVAADAEPGRGHAE